MIRIIDREIVRERSYAFPADSRLPQVASILPPRLRREVPAIEDEPSDLVFLRFFLQRRVASIHTRSGAIAWDATADCCLQLRHSPTGSLHLRLNLQPTGQTALAATLAASDDWQSGQGTNGQQAERRLEHAAIAHPALRGGGANEPKDNGDFHGPPESKIAFQPPVDESVRNGENGHNGQSGHGYVLLAILEPGSSEPHTILSADTYSLALVGRFRLLAEAIAGWMGTKIEIVSAS